MSKSKVVHENLQGKFIKTRRQKLKIGRKKLAKIIGICPFFMLQIERGDRPVPKAREVAFADVLGVRPQDIAALRFTRRRCRTSLRVPSCWMRQPDQEDGWGEFVWTKRITFEMSRDDFASILGVSPDTVLAWELDQSQPHKTERDRIRSVVSRYERDSWAHLR
jgi:DNA-binding XRE family transcriptional regulator